MGLAAYGKKTNQANLFIDGVPNTNLFISLFFYYNSVFSLFYNSSFFNYNSVFDLFF